MPHKAQTLYGLAKQARLYIARNPILPVQIFRRTGVLSRTQFKEPQNDNFLCKLAKQDSKNFRA